MAGSGPERGSEGSLIELMRDGAEPLRLPDGAERTFLEDGDDVVLRAHAERLELGEVRGRVVASLETEERVIPFTYQGSCLLPACPAHGGNQAMASILLSEADPDVRRLLVVLLERLGHQAIVLGGGMEAPPPADLLLLEPASPPHLEQARLARQLDPLLPIVCVSMLPEDERFPELGPLAYLSKPFALDELGSTIEAVLASTSVSA